MNVLQAPCPHTGSINNRIQCLELLYLPVAEQLEIKKIVKEAALRSRSDQGSFVKGKYMIYWEYTPQHLFRDYRLEVRAEVIN